MGGHFEVLACLYCRKPIGLLAGLPKVPRESATVARGPLPCRACRLLWRREDLVGVVEHEGGEGRGVAELWDDERCTGRWWIVHLAVLVAALRAAPPLAAALGQVRAGRVLALPMRFTSAFLHHLVEQAARG